MALSIPTQQPWQRVGIETRSVELAEKRDADRTCYADGVRFGHGTRDGHEIWYAASRHDTTVRYLVWYNPATDAVYECSCESRGACCHRGSVRKAIERRKARAAAEASDPTPAAPAAPVLAILPVAPRIVPTFTSPARAFGTCEGCGQTGRVLLAHTYPHGGGVEVVRMCASGCDMALTA